MHISLRFYQFCVCPCGLSPSRCYLHVNFKLGDIQMCALVSIFLQIRFMLEPSLNIVSDLLEHVSLLEPAAFKLSELLLIPDNEKNTEKS